jgi:hypothetical protein
MERFLKAKHWQMFILQFGIPVFLQIAMMITIFATLIANPDPYSSEPPQGMFTVMIIFFPLIIIIGAGSLFAWQWSVGFGLREKLPAGVRMRHGLFRIFMIVPILYFVVALSFMIYGFGHFTDVVRDPDMHTQGPGPGFFISLAFFIPLHLFSIFCLFYNMVFVAKTIKTVELQREATFGEYALEFVLTWFLPVGIWFLQPRINKIVRNEPANTF